MALKDTSDVSAKILGGTYTADADDQSAGTVSIDTGKTIAGAVVTVLRSNIAMADVSISYPYFATYSLINQWLPQEKL